MSFKPKLPDDAVNVSEPNMGIYGLKVIGGFVLVLATAFLILSAFATYFVTFIPVETENRLFKSFAILDDFKLSDDKYQVYAEKLLNKIPETVKPEGYNLSIAVVKNNDVNAYAMPGGQIILTQSLVDKIETENGLVFIIGHEIGHYHGRDHLKVISRQVLFATMSALILGQSSADIGSLNTLVNFGVDSHYSRGDERKADIWGVKALIETYGHAGGATQIFKEIIEESKLQQYGEFLSTHPVNEKRIQAIEDYIRENNLPVKNSIAKKI
jgi:predicted Zn-dependent protease